MKLLKKAEHERDEAKAQYSSSNTKLDSLSERLAEFKTVHDKSLYDLSEAKRELNQLKSNLHAVSEQFNQAKKQSMSVSVSKKEEEVEACETAKIQLSSALAAAKEEHDNAQEEISSLQSQVLAGGAEIDQAHRHCSDLEESLDQLVKREESALQELKQQVSLHSSVEEAFDQALAICEEVESDRSQLQGNQSGQL